MTIFFFFIPLIFLTTKRQKDAMMIPSLLVIHDLRCKEPSAFHRLNIRFAIYLMLRTLLLKKSDKKTDCSTRQDSLEEEPHSSYYQKYSTKIFLKVSRSKRQIVYLGSGIVNFVQTISQLTGCVTKFFSLLIKQPGSESKHQKCQEI